MKKLCFLFITIWFLSACSSSEISAPDMKNTYAIIPAPVELLPKEGQFEWNSKTTLKIDDPVPDGYLDQHLAFAQSASVNGPQNEVHLYLDNSIEGLEAYQLSITPQKIDLKAKTSAGLFYGIQSLRQLAMKKEGHLYFPALEIKDAPRYSYRGLHLDVGRHFFPVDFIKKYIDLLAYHKMNRFHWHLTEDQGWRIEIKKYPKLAQIAAYRKETLVGHYSDQPHQFDGQRYGGFYTQDEVKEVVQYAKERFVEVIPEIEMPGHSLAALAAYPELGCTPGPFEVGTKWGVFDEVYCPNDVTFQFLEDVLTEVMELFPSKYIHIGGDECPKIRWKESAFCQALIKKEGLKDEHELQSYFIKRIEKFVNSKGRDIIGWDEILEGGLAPNATVMSWRGIEGGIAAAKQGHNVIMTPTSHCYFDYYQSQAEDEPLAIGGFLPLRKVYSYEPTPEELTSEQQKYILGVQGNVWTEYIKTGDKVEYMTYPRACALAEIAWLPKEQKNYDDFVQRMRIHTDRLQEMGVNVAEHMFDAKAKIDAGNGVNISFFTEVGGTNLRYTADGSEPTLESPLYSNPLKVNASTTYKVAAFNEDEKLGRSYEVQFDWHKAAGKKIELTTQAAEKYSAGGIHSIVNGVVGSNVRYGDVEWLGFEGKDFEAVIDLAQEDEVNKVSLRFYQGNGQWIYLPKGVQVSISSDGTNYKTIAESKAVEGEGKVVTLSLDTNGATGRYLKIKVDRYGMIPEGRQGAGHEAWLFVDEIQVY